MKKYLFGVIAVALAVLSIAFTNKPQTLGSGYHYTSSSTNINDVRNVALNWDYEAVTTSCGSGSNLPCIFNRSEDDAAFSAYLANTTMFPDVASVTAAANEKKP